MSTDGNGNGSVLDDGSSVASNQQNAIDGEIIKTKGSQTPRFTQEEKQILYSLFQEHEEVIDIKFRKKSRNKYSVRDAWEQIVSDFNSHPNVNAIRSCKQIQKFWLNSRLRKQYPFGNQKQDNAANRSRIPQTVVQQQQQQQQAQQQQQLINHAIKTEPEFQMGSSDTNDHNDQSESYEEIEMDGSTVTEDLDDDPLEAQQQHQQQEQAQQQQQQQTQLQQVVPTSTIHVDQISTNKITLTDLLQFKTTRPREEIILQIKHAGDATGSQITLPPPAPTRITIPPHHQAQPTMATITTNGYNQQIISEIKPQQITLAQYQAQQQLQQQQLAQQQQQQLVAQQAQLAVIQQDQQQQQQRQAAAASAMAAAQQVKMQLQSTPIIGTSQFATATPTFTCTTFSALPAVAAASAAAATVPSNNITVSNATAIPTVATITTTATLVNSSPLNNNNNVTTALQQQPQEPSLFMEKMNYFRLKEAELRVKEQQVTLERKKMELAYAEHQLKHLREVHRLQVEEFKVKIRIIQEEEIRLKKTMPSLPS